MLTGVGPDTPTATNAAGGKQSHLPFRCDLLPARAALHIAEILATGAAKYGIDNWRKISVREHINHALTHLFAHLADDNQDDHLGHAACRLQMALEIQLVSINKLPEFVYLASPYSHADSSIKEWRFRTVCKVADTLMARGMIVFSPIAHSHPIEVASGIIRDWNFWRQQDMHYLAIADAMYVLTLDGWTKSLGVTDEIAYAKSHGIPIKYVDPTGADFVED